MDESPGSSVNHDCFIGKRHDLERMARGVGGSVGPGAGDWCTDPNQCSLRPYTAMARIAVRLSMYPSAKNVASYAIFILDCTEKSDKSLDEIYHTGEREKFLGLFRRLEELYQSTDFQD